MAKYPTHEVWGGYSHNGECDDPRHLEDCFSREWLKRTVNCLQGELPPGRIGDVVFLLRDILQDILDKAPASSSLTSNQRGPDK